MMLADPDSIQIIRIPEASDFYSGPPPV